VAGKSFLVSVALLATLVLVPAAHAVNPRVAGLQVALRAFGLYVGPIDGIAGPQTTQATRAFQRRAGLVADGVAGPRTRRALGPLGQPSFGSRTIRRQAFGWDVSVLQFLLARHGALVPIDGYYDGATEQALRRFQRTRRLQADGIVGPLTFKALIRGRAKPKARSAGPPQGVRALLEHWSRTYGVDPGLVRALAWMESGYQPGIVSRAGARGVLQVLPSTKQYVEKFLLHRRVPWTVSGEIQVGVVYLRELLRRSHGNESLALAVWYQGPTSVRRNGVFRVTRAFVADVLALQRRGV
jgi:Putative peptidoglycan binding domain/Transglycosylase SLT domain